MKNEGNNLDAIEAGLLALHRVTFQHQAWEAIQRRAGITLDRADATLLKVLDKCEQPCRMQTIARHLGIEAPSVTRTVQRLEEAGLISRHPDPEDGRASNLSLTKMGTAQLNKLHRARQERLRTATADWTNAERQQLGTLLQRLADDLSNKLDI